MEESPTMPESVSAWKKPARASSSAAADEICA
jgi:hypothetical protein